MTEERLEAGNKLVKEINNIREWINDIDDFDSDSIGTLFYNFPDLKDDIKKIIKNYLDNKLTSLQNEFERL